MRQKIDSLPADEAKEVHRILGSQANDRRELGDLSPAAFELGVIAWIRHRFMDTQWTSALVQVVIGGVLVFLTGVLLGIS